MIKYTVMKELDFIWTDAEVKKILHAATGNIKDFVMDNDGFLEQFKVSHTPGVKRDWEILKGGFESATVHEWEESCHNVGCDIWSVRRISDNTIWTVGDKFNGNAGHEVTIKGFDVVEGREPFPSRLRVLSVEYGGWDISRISKPLQRTPLFKTEDGVDIFSDTPIWIVFSNFEMKSGVVFIDGHQQIMKYLYKPENNKYFFSKDKAKEYVILNKPCLSVNDAIKAFEEWKHENEFFEDYIKQFAKQRLDKQ